MRGTGKTLHRLSKKKISQIMDSGTCSFSAIYDMIYSSSVKLICALRSPVSPLPLAVSRKGRWRTARRSAGCVQGQNRTHRRSLCGGRCRFSKKSRGSGHGTPLHIQRRAFQVESISTADHRDGDTGGQLPHRQGDGLFVVGDGGFYPVKALVLVRVVQLAVRRQGSPHSPGTPGAPAAFSPALWHCPPVQRPEGVLQFNTQLRVENEIVLGVMASKKRSTSASCSKAPLGFTLKEPKL